MLKNALNRRQFLASSGAAGCLVMSRPVWAAAFPSKPVEILVGFTAGGGVDTYARGIAEALKTHLGGQPAIVVNKVGAGGNLAILDVMGQSANGYRVSATSAGSSIFSTLFGDDSVDIQRDLKPVGTIGDLTATLFVNANSPYKNVAEWIEGARSAKRPFRWAHSARRGNYHVAGEALLQSLNIEARDVPFNGVAEARNVLVSGEIDFAILGTQHLVGFEKQLRALAVFAENRDPSAPDIPTMAESKVNVPNISTRVVLHVHRDTPEPELQFLAEAVQKAAQSDVYHDIMKRAGLPVLYLGPQETQKWTDAAMVEWKPVVERIKAALAQ